MRPIFLFYKHFFRNFLFLIKKYSFTFDQFYNLGSQHGLREDYFWMKFMKKFWAATKKKVLKCPENISVCALESLHFQCKKSLRHSWSFVSKPKKESLFIRLSKWPNQPTKSTLNVTQTNTKNILVRKIVFRMFIIFLGNLKLKVKWIVLDR